MSKRTRAPVGRGGAKPPLWKRVYERIVRLDGSPERIAGGVAVGVVLGVGPTLGIGLVAAAGVAAFFRFNVAAAMLGALTGFPPLLPLTWGASCYLGGVILGKDWHGIYGKVQSGAVWDAGGDILLAYITGNLLLTAFLASLAYVITLKLVQWRRLSEKPPS